MDSADEHDEMMMGDALIRSNFHADPATLTPDEWARLFAEAVWLEGWRLRNQTRALASLFGVVQKDSRQR